MRDGRRGRACPVPLPRRGYAGRFVRSDRRGGACPRPCWPSGSVRSRRRATTTRPLGRAVAPTRLPRNSMGWGFFHASVQGLFGGSCGREGPNVACVSELAEPSGAPRADRLRSCRTEPACVQHPCRTEPACVQHPHACVQHPHVSKIYTRRAISYGRVGPNARVSEIQNGPQAGTALRQKLRALRFRLSKCTNNSGVRSSVTAVAKVRPPMIDRAMGM